MRPSAVVHTLRRLSPERRRWALRAAWWVPLVRVGLWLLPYGRLHRLVHRGPAPSRRDAAGTAEVQRVRDVVWAVVAVSRRVPRATCLTQALAAQRLLADVGVRAELRIGVARDAGGAFEAHAWLEHEGRIVLGEVDGMERFTTLTGGGSSP